MSPRETSWYGTASGRIIGDAGRGDPACNLAIAWTAFAGESRETFRAALPLDDATWARPWLDPVESPSLPSLPSPAPTPLPQARRRIIDDVLADHARLHDPHAEQVRWAAQQD